MEFDTKYCGGCTKWEGSTETKYVPLVMRVITDAARMVNNPTLPENIRASQERVLQLARSEGVQAGRMNCTGPNLNLISFNITECPRPEDYRCRLAEALANF